MPESQYHGPKLLTKVLEDKAEWIGDHTYLRYPNDDWETEGYRTMTWRQYADSVNKVAHWLDQQLGVSQSRDTIAYMGPSDARYAIMFLAAIKTDRKLLIPDGRLTDKGLASLLHETNCIAWIHAEGDDLPRGLPDSIKRCALPCLAWCLDSQDHPRYPYNKTFDEAKWDEVLIIHTSGTTGIPKAIFLTNGFNTVIGSFTKLSRLHWPRSLVPEVTARQATLSACPPQWLGGLVAYVFAPMYYDISTIVPPADVTGLPPAVFKKIVTMNKVDGILCPPHCIHELYNDIKSQGILRSFNFITYLGAPLDRAIGDDLSQSTKITCMIGSTETGLQWQLQCRDRKYWYTHEYIPENGHRMVKIQGHGTDNLYELVLDRAEDGQPNLYQSAFWNPANKDVNTIETNELYAPIKDGAGRTRWVFTARKDDLTKLSWLAKFHAQDIEARVKRHPDIYEVIVGGEGRPTPYIIVEPRQGVLDSKSPDALLDELYEGVVTQSNKADVQEISIPKETVLIAKSDKPFQRTAKHTLKRKAIEQDYADEIEEAYARLTEANPA
ncbi:acetyl-CoA synthetase-like protein [Lophiostoma macrostomum CBS 122681]|uniref:Acetyl-CoA synthetase-like protein n=1 Tax=Lophiostoma macrostomum CBS 122681 TaxID=1314788 RepID=A0A6A6TN05_9PLEO|nr:acetyl-CoA synthetase-like protein [Lophiostoma macrostomum CBS 122681]